MKRILDFFSDSFQPLLGGKKYEDWKRDSLDLQKVKIRDKKLADELELECRKNGGVLTYAEFLQIEQFGNNGYHSKNKYHGFTPTYLHWIHAVFTYVSENNIHDILELGPGPGDLAEGLFKLCDETDYKLTWHAVEVGDMFRESLKTKFKNHDKYLGSIVKIIDELPKLSHALIISSFCIDSIPPHLFINITNSITYPTSILGINVTGGIATECVLNENQLREKGIGFKNGIYTHNEISFSLTNWKLSPYQRAYITTDGFELLIKACQKVKNPTLLVIDEFRKTTRMLRTDHYLPPLYLNKNKRHTFNPKKGYERSGEMLLYYPIYLGSLLSVLKSIGLTNIRHDADPKLAAELAHRTWKPPKQYVLYLCLGVLAQGKFKVPKTVPISFPPVN